MRIGESNMLEKVTGFTTLWKKKSAQYTGAHCVGLIFFNSFVFRLLRLIIESVGCRVVDHMRSDPGCQRSQVPSVNVIRMSNRGLSFANGGIGSGSSS